MTANTDALRALAADMRKTAPEWAQPEKALAFYADAIEALAATSADRAEGWVLVPRQITSEMEDAADQREDDEPLSDWGKHVAPSRQEIWTAMLAAIPPTPPAGASSAGQEAVAWLTPESIAHLAKQNGVAKVDAWNCASGNERVPVYLGPTADAGALLAAMDKAERDVDAKDEFGNYYAPDEVRRYVPQMLAAIRALAQGGNGGR